ncbi:hypothetical protein NDU88_006593 [Pleurodeles waltl]|uniref:Uncharacterized protein n=1 Tax=Pleurodeles waltl TaxID=8319 RepID=A0AAV7NTK0_PLEWA|nr:hypothetical protein NDU88_006593 [Pleurodeles waltl]
MSAWLAGPESHLRAVYAHEILKNTTRWDREVIPARSPVGRSLEWKRPARVPERLGRNEVKATRSKKLLSHPQHWRSAVPRHTELPICNTAWGWTPRDPHSPRLQDCSAPLRMAVRGGLI